MQDRELMALYRAGDKRAATESEARYGGSCIRIARNILDNSHEADVCVTDACAIPLDAPPHDEQINPEIYLGKLTRELAIGRFKASQSAKRGESLFQVILDELSTCAPAGSTGFGSGFDDETEAATVGASINRFLRKQKGEVRDLFICRYFYAESLGEISRRFGLSEKRVHALLRRTREKLRKHLESEGIRL